MPKIVFTEPKTLMIYNREGFNNFWIEKLEGAEEVVE